MADVQFSVVIPTYNREKLIARAIDSALNQNYRPTEVIVVDDGSKDATQQVVAQYGDSVRYIRQDNAGSAVARDNGIRQAVCLWVALLDSDDLWTPEHLQRMHDAISQTHGKANYYFADTLHPPDRGGAPRWETVGFQPEAKIAFTEDGTDWALMNPQPMMLQSSVLNKKAYVAVGGFLDRLRFRDDTHLFLRLGLNSPICAVSGIGAEMTADDDPGQRLTVSYGDAKRAEGHQMQVWMFSDLLNVVPNLRQDARQEIQRRLVGAHRSLARDARREGKLLVTGLRLATAYLLRLRYAFAR